jgi:hypothetical protein
MRGVMRITRGAKEAVCLIWAIVGVGSGVNVKWGGIAFTCGVQAFDHGPPETWAQGGVVFRYNLIAFRLVSRLVSPQEAHYIFSKAPGGCQSLVFSE